MPQGPPEFTRFPFLPKGYPEPKPPENLLQAVFQVCVYGLVFVGSVIFLVAFFFANGPKIGRWIESAFLWTVDLLRI